MTQEQRISNNGELYVEIITPDRQRFAIKKEIDRRTFYDFLQPVHINKHPFLPDNPKEIKAIQERRDEFVKLLTDSVINAFDKFFESIDTKNGFKMEEWKRIN